MILFFGVRPGKTKQDHLYGANCTFCRQSDTLEATRIPHYFHIFWVPLFRLYESEFIECSHCRKAYNKEEFTADMKRALQQ